MVSVKSVAPVPKENIFDVMDKIRSTSVEAPVKIGDIIIPDLYGVDIVATKDIL